MTITEFLLARIAEDEDQAHELIRRQRRKLTVRDVSLGYVRAFDPKRIAAECAAKRRIVQLHSGEHECSIYDYDGSVFAFQWCSDAMDCSTMQLLAAVYTDHSDYDPAWRV